MKQTEECQLPAYISHKRVWALKIMSVQKYPDGRGVIYPTEANFTKFFVSKEYMAKHEPQAGGYWVQYEDGYESYSPDQAFETGYTPMYVAQRNTAIVRGVFSDIDNYKFDPAKHKEKQLAEDENCYTKARQRHEATFTLIERDLTSPQTIAYWILLNIETATPAKLFDALADALVMRGNPNRKHAD